MLYEILVHHQAVFALQISMKFKTVYFSGNRSSCGYAPSISLSLQFSHFPKLCNALKFSPIFLKFQPQNTLRQSFYEKTMWYLQFQLSNKLFSFFIFNVLPLLVCTAVRPHSYMAKGVFTSSGSIQVFLYTAHLADSCRIKKDSLTLSFFRLNRL